MRDRLTSSQIVVMRELFMHGAQTRPITVLQWQRQHAIPLWRRGLVEMWFRQFPDVSPSSRGPYFSLFGSGAELAAKFFPAPRGTSGAMEQT